MKRIHITGIILVVVTVLLSSFTFYFYQVFFSANFLTEDSEDRFFQHTDRFHLRRCAVEHL
jgi:hypothetical protein